MNEKVERPVDGGNRLKHRDGAQRGTRKAASEATEREPCAYPRDRWEKRRQQETRQREEETSYETDG